MTSNAYKIIHALLSGNLDQILKEKAWKWLLAPFNQKEKEEALQAMWKECHAEADASTYRSFRKFRETEMYPRRQSLSLYKKIARAAAILLIPLLSVATAYLYVQKQNLPIEFIECFVPEGTEYKTVWLPDGAKVNLNAGTLLIYPNRFSGDIRSVFLSGEANFTVPHDKEHPFIVKTNYLKVRVLGTKFNIRAYAQDTKTITTLEYGSVAIQKATEDKNLALLEPNEQLEYDNLNGQFNKKKADASLYSGWTKGELNFISQPLKEIVRTLERTYGVDILIDPHLLTTDLYTIKFRQHEKIAPVLNIIMKTVGNIAYKQRDENTILIYSLKEMKGER